MTWKTNVLGPIEGDAFDPKALGVRLRRLRRERRWREIDLAERARVQPWVIHRCERGKSLPKVDNLIRLAAALGVSLDALLIGEPDRSHPSPEELREIEENVRHAVQSLPSFALLSATLYDVLARVGRDLKRAQPHHPGGTSG